MVAGALCTAAALDGGELQAVEQGAHVVATPGLGRSTAVRCFGAIELRGISVVIIRNARTKNVGKSQSCMVDF